MLETDPALASLAPSGAVRLADSVRQVREAGEPLIVLIKGQGELVVRDPASWDLLVELVEHLERIDQVRDRLQDFAEGKPGLSLEQAKAHVRHRYGISV